MSEKKSALFSSYIIDGAQQEFSPAQLLKAEMDGQRPEQGEFGLVEKDSDITHTIIDESADPPVRSMTLELDDMGEYLDLVCATKRVYPLAYSSVMTSSIVVSALIDAIWNKGHFMIGDLRLSADWRWDEDGVGSMAAFYESARTVAEAASALQIAIDSYSYEAVAGERSLKVGVSVIPSAPDDENTLTTRAFSAGGDVNMLSERAVPAVFEPDPQSWVIFVPFDQSEFRLGGSLLAQALGFGGASPQMPDADYFLDCYEVVREFVEDRAVLSGCTVGEGGLLAALKKMTADGTGMEIDISDLKRSTQVKNNLRLLFAEVPGVIFQIRDVEFDYFDAELLLQDVAFFPLGHPTPGREEIRIKASAKTGIQTILESLIDNAEGED